MEPFKINQDVAVCHYSDDEKKLLPHYTLGLCGQSLGSCVANRVRQIS